MIRTKGLLFLLVFFLSCNLFATGVRGTVRGDDGKPLPYATIYVKETGSGTTTNEEGYYEITLAAGAYSLVYQFLGFQTELRKIEITDRFIELNIVLKVQTTLLREVTVKAGNEDPAYTIMRKAIAKADYHQNQIDQYKALVYIKGTGRLKDYPWLFKKALEKEGVTKDRLFVTESVSEVTYTRPAKFEERVISIYSNGKDNNTSPNQFIYGSFYEPVIGGTISPLSPKAFSYYRFEYAGTFRDRDYSISKIKVTPRSKGDDVVDGIIYIVEDWWSIHSLDIHTSKYGIDFFVKSVYAPIEEKAWLPVSHQFKMDGKVFGFDFEYNYLATIKDYKIKLNEELYIDNTQMEVVDEKLEKEHAKQIEKNHKPESGELQKRLESGKEITRKELKTLVKEYEKQELKQQDEPEVVSNVSFKVDSGAYKKDSAYWALMRPVPLTREEIKGYEKADSLAEVEQKKEAGDTLKRSKHAGFQPWDLILGDTYKMSKHANLVIHPLESEFNTVEGYAFPFRVSFGVIMQDTNKTSFSITPRIRYAIAREKISGTLQFLAKNKTGEFKMEGGRYVQQFNHGNPISPLVNTITTLFLEKNLMKLYERDYVDISYARIITPFMTVSTSWSWNERYQLFNNTNYKLINRKHIEGYTPNTPENIELEDTAFPDHHAFIGSVAVTVQPWLKYRIRNGVKYPIQDSSPAFTMSYHKGFDGMLNSDVDFDRLEAGMKYQFNVGIRGKIDMSLQAGAFLNASQLYFMDYKHFAGNQTPFTTTDPVGSFRLLDYYLYSTSDKYFTGSIHYQFRKFLVTSFPLLRLTGIRENVFVNYLAAPASHNYTEAGYSIDGIFRIFRLEVAAAFQDGKYLDYGVRVGIAARLQFE